MISKSKNLLFDVCGVRIAQTPEQITQMQAYQEKINSRPESVDSRVPRNGMVIEYACRNQLISHDSPQGTQPRPFSA